MLILVLGAGAWIGVSQFSGNRPATAAEMAQTIQQNRSALIDGIRAGQPLYYKSEEYLASPGMGYPQWTIAETWLVAGSDGLISDAVSKNSDRQGNLLGYGFRQNGANFYTDVATGFTFELPLDWTTPIADSFAAFWDGLQIQKAGTEFKGRGTLNTRTSLVYERSVPAEESYVKTEIVEDNPLLFRSSIYKGSSAKPANLIRQDGIDEYRLLPVGSALPDPAAEASAGGAPKPRAAFS